MEYDTSVSGLTAPKEKMTKEEQIQKLREKIAILIYQETAIELAAFIDEFAVGVRKPREWQNLPHKEYWRAKVDQLLAPVKEVCYPKAERELPENPYENRTVSTYHFSNDFSAKGYRKVRQDMLIPDLEGRIWASVYKEW